MATMMGYSKRTRGITTKGYYTVLVILLILLSIVSLYSAESVSSPFPSPSPSDPIPTPSTDALEPTPSSEAVIPTSSDPDDSTDDSTEDSTPTLEEDAVLHEQIKDSVLETIVPHSHAALDNSDKKEEDSEENNNNEQNENSNTDERRDEGNEPKRLIEHKEGEPSLPEGHIDEHEPLGKFKERIMNIHNENGEDEGEGEGEGEGNEEGTQEQEEEDAAPIPTESNNGNAAAVNDEQQPPSHNVPSPPVPSPQPASPSPPPRSPGSRPPSNRGEIPDRGRGNRAHSRRTIPVPDIPSQDPSPPSPSPRSPPSREEELIRKVQQEQSLERERHRRTKQIEEDDRINALRTAMSRGHEGHHHGEVIVDKGQGQGQGAEDTEASRIANARLAGDGHESHKDRVRGHVHPNGQIHVISDDPHRRIQHGSHSHTVEETEEKSGFILFIMLAIIMLSQAGLFCWKKYYTRSFDFASLVGLWLIPCIWSFYGGFWRMLLIWLAYSVVTGLVMQKAMRSPVEKGTPRLVYKFFSFIYKGCYGMAVGGYLMMMADFVGLSLLLPSSMAPLAPLGLICIFYGLYYGVVSRDLSSFCSQQMAVNIGYIAAKGDMPKRELPLNHCAICDYHLTKSIRLTDNNPDEIEEQVHKLSCGHSFHDSCIRGWTIIGKRDTCPNCSEKVRLREIFTNPWENQNLVWGVILDALRYMIVFNPIIILTAQSVLAWIW